MGKVDPLCPELVSIETGRIIEDHTRLIVNLPEASAVPLFEWIDMRSPPGVAFSRSARPAVARAGRSVRSGKPTGKIIATVVIAGPASRGPPLCPARPCRRPSRAPSITAAWSSVKPGRPKNRRSLVEVTDYDGEVVEALDHVRSPWRVRQRLRDLAKHSTSVCET
jgi:hypothetical protein